MVVGDIMPILQTHIGVGLTLKARKSIHKIQQLFLIPQLILLFKLPDIYQTDITNNVDKVS